MLTCFFYTVTSKQVRRLCRLANDDTYLSASGPFSCASSMFMTPVVTLHRVLELQASEQSILITNSQIWASVTFVVISRWKWLASSNLHWCLDRPASSRRSLAHKVHSWAQVRLPSTYHRRYCECLYGSDKSISENISHRNIDASIKNTVHAIIAARIWRELTRQPSGYGDVSMITLGNDIVYTVSKHHSTNLEVTKSIKEIATCSFIWVLAL